MNNSKKQIASFPTLQKPLIYLLPVLIALSGCGGSRANLKKSATTGDEIVEAEGMVPYKADDLPGTKAGALAAAQRSAVELVVGVYVNAKTRVEKAVAVENNILTNAQGYVKKYEILSEGRSGDYYKVRIRALVSTQKLHNDMDAMGLLRQPAIGNPRIALMVQEWIGENRDKANNATRTLTQGLLNKGFQVVELPSTIDRDSDPVDLARSLSRGQAELILAGLARAQSLGYTSKDLGGLSSYRAAISLRVIEVGTGQILTTVSEVASGLEGTPEIAGGKSLEKAAELAVADLVNLPDELSKRSLVTLTINGITDFSKLSDFEKGLTSQPGVKDLFLRSFTQSSGEAVLELHIDGISPQDLADQCVRIGGAGWSVYQVVGRSIQLSASPAGR